MQFFKPLAALLILGVSAAVQAVPVTYTMTVDFVTGNANGVGVGPGATTVIAINSDTTSVGVFGALSCNQGTSGTIAITGINGGAPQALTGTYYVCASAAGNNVGVYDSPPSLGGGTVHGGNGGGATGLLTGAPAVNLISNLGPATYVAGSIHSHGAALSLLAGGTYTASQPEAGPNTTASNFRVTLTAVNAAPTASAVSITGTPQTGGTLTGNYTYADANGDAQGNSTFRWMSGSQNSGFDKKVINGATGATYSPVAADGGNYLFFCVTPVASTGVLTGTEVCSSGTLFTLVPTIGGSASVGAFGPNPLVPLDLSGGYGPTLTNCLMTTARQILGADAVYLGQVDGGARISVGGKVISFYPLKANAATGQSADIHLLATNDLNVGTSCGSLNAVPALYNPTEFIAVLNAMGLSPQINALGVITVAVGSNLYVVRPDYVVTPGRAGTASLTLGTDGLYRFTDSAGNTQLMRAAFLNTDTLQALAGALMGGYVAIQSDGTGLLTRLDGSQAVLVPAMVLGGVPASLSITDWVSDAPNHFLYRVGGYSQGLSSTPR